ncbi:hypothetical protein FJT64_001056 [Amphibalanus amphitrite]|uniref:Peptidase aspartic putative domain-containing protein n=1 Tax=Amphibalanus amphitrite TaxID=1232801 RepID=A0A6A4VF52_AMPAM|nr:hypothetical protein FJT64_001056 [Amphibalanus amphitrite]
MQPRREGPRGVELDGVVLADPLESESLHIDILVGVDQFWQLVSGETRVLREGMVAQRTVFGWVLSGQLDGVVLADPLESESLHIDILVGVDQFWQLVSGETRVLREGMVAQRTVFGWVLSGQPGSWVQLQKLEQLPAGVGYEVGVALKTQRGVLWVGALRLGEQSLCQGLALALADGV